jgi:hypothetical protein
MKTRDNIARKAGLAGAVIGLVLFAVVGVLYGSLIGGTMGLGIVNSVLGVAPATHQGFVAASCSRVIVQVCSNRMHKRAWLAGYIIGAVMEPKSAVVQPRRLTNPINRIQGPATAGRAYPSLPPVRVFCCLQMVQYIHDIHAQSKP